MRGDTKVYWVGWYNKNSSDKIWGIVQVGNTFYNFWARRQARIQFKQTDDIRYMHKLKKGYQEITTEKLVQIFPTFFDDCQRDLLCAILTNRT